MHSKRHLSSETNTIVATHVWDWVLIIISITPLGTHACASTITEGTTPTLWPPIVYTMAHDHLRWSKYDGDGDDDHPVFLLSFLCFWITLSFTTVHQCICTALHDGVIVDTSGHSGWSSPVIVVTAFMVVLMMQQICIIKMAMIHQLVIIIMIIQDDNDKEGCIIAPP